MSEALEEKSYRESTVFTAASLCFVLGAGFASLFWDVSRNSSDEREAQGEGQLNDSRATSGNESTTDNSSREFLSPRSNDPHEARQILLEIDEQKARVVQSLCRSSSRIEATAARWREYRHDAGPIPPFVGYREVRPIGLLYGCRLRIVLRDTEVVTAYLGVNAVDERFLDSAPAAVGARWAPEPGLEIYLVHVDKRLLREAAAWVIERFGGVPGTGRPHVELPTGQLYLPASPLDPLFPNLPSTYKLQLDLDWTAEEAIAQVTLADPADDAGHWHCFAAGTRSNGVPRSMCWVSRAGCLARHSELEHRHQLGSCQPLQLASCYLIEAAIDALSKHQCFATMQECEYERAETASYAGATQRVAASCLPLPLDELRGREHRQR